MTQAELARKVHVDKTLASRWATGKVPLRGAHARKVAAILRERGVNIELHSGCRVFLSTPMAALSTGGYGASRAEANAVHVALSAVAAPVYWAAGAIDSADRFEAPDLATERNLVALAECESFVFFQSCELDRPTSCHIELGYALALRKPVTVFVPDKEVLPYMLRGFEVVAARQDGRYRFHRSGDALRLLEIHGPELLGLAPAVST